MSLIRTTAICGLVLGLLGCTSEPLDDAQGIGELQRAQQAAPESTATAEVVARGIPGAGAIVQVAAFHRGSPLHDNPIWIPYTLSGQVLDPTRLLVASSSNFGAPLARPGDAPGSILSLASSGSLIDVPPAFAVAGDQASALGGAVRLYTAQSPNFLNSINTPTAATAALPAASLPTSISLNNGHGRPWLANAPSGSDGDGTITVLDGNGRPLAGGPDPVAGGVFAGDLTNRNAATTHGLTNAALATAIITKSPDGTGRAVFAAALADGSVVQVHVQKGVDGLAPPGSFTPIPQVSVAAAESTDPETVARVGIAFNWVPQRILYVTDPYADRILALDLSDDGVLFGATARYLSAPQLNVPVDIAPSIPEVSADNFASGSTLGGGADLFVLNRGDNTIVRLSQEGEVIAVRAIAADLPEFRVNGLALSTDGQTIWVTATTPDQGGVVLRLPAFGAGPIMPGVIADALAAGASTIEEVGGQLFGRRFVPDEGVGPLFNAQGCVSCHNAPIPGGMGNVTVLRVGRLKHGALEPVAFGGPVARAHSIDELGVTCGLPIGAPPDTDATSVRSAMTLRGTSLIDFVQVRDLLAAPAAEPADVRGRPNLLADGRVGRFGWKADQATLVEFMGDAYRTEMGLTNPLAPEDFGDGCGASRIKPELDAVALVGTAAFLNTIDPPAPTSACLTSAGATTFAAIGCASCHKPSYPGPGGRLIRLYSDLLLHDMGAGLADGFVQGSAGGSEFRTMPLWRVSDRTRLLHDGRSSTIPEAIHAHGGQAAASAGAFDALSAADRAALLDFLGCI